MKKKIEMKRFKSITLSEINFIFLLGTEGADLHQGRRKTGVCIRFSFFSFFLFRENNHVESCHRLPHPLLFAGRGA
jgi:hypothetical protein